MLSSKAQQIIEALRKGIPPDGYVCHFTVGRQTEIESLKNRLTQCSNGALLLKANYGSGKTHLLRFIREMALQEGYAVSLIALDAQSAIRFNRMDQILGAIFRCLEIPGEYEQKGVRPFLNLICRQIEDNKSRRNNSFWRDLTSEWNWNFSQALDSRGLYVALRAWSTGIAWVHDLIEDWLMHPNIFQSRRKFLYDRLVYQLRNFFRDPRPEWKFYDDGVFQFNIQGYEQSWAVLRDINKLSIAAGLRGFIILFDEFEDIIYNLKNIKHQEAAFWNLFEFYMGKKFSGLTFFAVTPDFVKKCKNLLMIKGKWDYDYSIFDKLPAFEMSPLTIDELEALAHKIMELHCVAYEWDPNSLVEMSEFKTIIKNSASVQVQDRARYTIKEIVKYLDRAIEDYS